jgi:hypothetical protein
MYRKEAQSLGESVNKALRSLVRSRLEELRVERAWNRVIKMENARLREQKLLVQPRKLPRIS